VLKLPAIANPRNVSRQFGGTQKKRNLNMSNYREYGFHFMTIVLVFGTIFFVIPNLSTDTKDYNSKTKIIESSRIDEEERTGKGFQKRVEYTLVLVMSDKTELKFSDSEYSKYFEELKSSKNFGEKIKYYSRNNGETMNPSQVEIDGKIVYNLKERMNSKYLLILLTIGFLTYSLYKLNLFIKKRNN
jgi:hypothetical protein